MIDDIDVGVVLYSYVMHMNPTTSRAIVEHARDNACMPAHSRSHAEVKRFTQALHGLLMYGDGLAHARAEMVVPSLVARTSRLLQRQVRALRARLSPLL